MSRIRSKRIIRPDYKYAAFFIPLIGIIVTLILGAAGAFIQFTLGDPFFTAVGILIVQYLLFNIFHFDGLLDSADALIVFAGREKRLEILKDVKTGSFAFFSGTIYLIVKVYLLFKGIGFIFQTDIAALIMLLSYPVSGRSAASFIPCLLRPAREGGLGALLSGSRLRHAAAGTLLSVSIAAIPVLLISPRGGFFGWLPLLSFSAALPAILLSGIAYKRKIGGYTGDALGLAVEAGELLHLILFYFIVRGIL